ncbi:MAG: hypothetical protein MHM6MM_004702 [Cercozoa sp. M6MM]
MWLASADALRVTHAPRIFRVDDLVNILRSMVTLVQESTHPPESRVLAPLAAEDKGGGMRLPEGAHFSTRSDSKVRAATEVLLENDACALRVIALALEYRSVAPTQQVLAQGGRSDGLFVVLSGALVTLRDGRKLARLGDPYQHRYMRSVEGMGGIKAGVAGVNCIRERPALQFEVTCFIISFPCLATSCGTIWNTQTELNNEATKVSKKYGLRTSVAAGGQTASFIVRMMNQLRVKYKQPQMERKVPFGRLRLLGFLGKGTLSSVELVRDVETRRVYALKRMPKHAVEGTKQIKYVLAERVLLRQLKHPGIPLPLYASRNHVFLLLQAFLGGSLHWHMHLRKRKKDRVVGDVRFARFVLAELVDILEYLHSAGVIYRDLRPSNIVFDNKGHVSLVDFAFAHTLPLDEEEDRETHTERLEAKSTVGTLTYLSPETILGQPQGEQRTRRFGS